MTKQATVVWTDVAGSAALRVIRTASGIGAIEADMKAISNAAIVTCAEGILDVFTTSPVNAQYPLINTSVILIFADGSGSQGRLIIPSPKVSIFMPDNETVDPTTITTLIADAIGNLLSGSGNPVTVFVGGYLYRGRVSGYGSGS